MFYYTNQGKQGVIDGVNDLKEFNQTMNALSTLNLKSKDQNSIFKILSGILHLGNIMILEAENEGCTISVKDKHLDVSLELFQVNREYTSRFRRSLTSRQIISGKEIFTKPLKNNEAAFRRDALAKHIYARLFGWIVAKLNGSLASSTEIHRCVGILDIYGFETFDSNSFEQLCINFSNEKLQQQFSNHVFKLEQEEYAQEGLEWKFIDYQDNQPCIDLIEGKLGILDILDDECKFSAGSDESWLRNLEKNCCGNKYFEKPKRSGSKFAIEHFAGKVEYQVSGFIEKNRDTIDPEQIAILQLSSNPLLVSLFEEEGVFASAEPRKIAGTVPRKLGALVFKEIQPSAKSTLRRTKRTVGSQFKDSLTQLMQSLNSTCPHYIRCIKPNDSKVAFEFDPHRVVQQLRACGILETVRISAAGFPSRMSYDQFVNRYYQLAAGLRKAEPRKICENVLLNLIDDSEVCKFGQTKVFFRSGKIAQLEKLRNNLLWKSSVIIQKTWRGCRQRKLYRQLKKTVISIQARVRGNCARAKAKALRQNKAAIQIQRRFRGWLSRRRYNRIRSMIIGLQANGRGFLVRQAILKRKQVEKVTVIQKNVRMWLAVQKYRNIKMSIIIAQSCVRRWLAKRELKKLKLEARSIESVKNLNKGLEIKIMQLQMDLDERNKEVVNSHKKLKSQCVFADELAKTLKTREETIVGLEKRVASIENLKEEIKRLKENEVDLVNALSEAQKREDNLAKTNLSLVEKIGKLEKAVTAEAEHSRTSQVFEGEVIETCRGVNANNVNYQQIVQENEILRERLEDFEEHFSTTKNGLVYSSSSEEFEEEEVGSPSSAAGVYVSPEKKASKDSISKVALALRKRNMFLEIECDVLRKQLDSFFENDPKQNVVCMKLQDLEMRNSKLLQDIQQLRESISVSNEEGLKSIMFQFSAMQEELERRRDEVLQLRLHLSNGDLAKPEVGTNRSDADDWKEVCRAQKASLQHMEQHHKVEKQCLKQEVGCLRDIIARQQQEIEESILNNQESFTLNDDYVHLLQEAVNLKDKLEIALAHIEKLKKKFSFTSPPEMLSQNLLHGSQIVKEELQPQGLLKYNSHDAEKLAEMIVCKFTPNVAQFCIQGTAAYLIFMALRFGDTTSDEIGVKKITNSAITHIKKIVQENHFDQDLCLLWMANSTRFLHCIRQYSCDPNSTYTRSNTKKQLKMCLINYDMSSFIKPFEDLVNFIYSKFWETTKEKLSGLIYPAIILYDSVSLSSTPFTPNRRGSERYIAPKTAWIALMDQLNHLNSLCNVFGVDPSVAEQLYQQLFYFISTEVLNSLLLRKDMCNWATGVIIRYNITNLEQWIRDNVPQGSNKAAPILKTLQPVINASHLFQAKKTIEDVDNLVSFVDELTAPQILKLLHLYTPLSYEEVSAGFLSAVERKLKGIRPPSEFDAQILADSNYSFPLNITHCPSTVDLETVQIPYGMSIPATLS